MTDMQNWTGNGFEVDGLYYDTEHDYYEQQCLDKLGFCGCGNPDKCLDLITKILELLNRNDKEKWNELKQINDTETMLDIIYYMLDDKLFTDHGGCIPGWASDKGIELLKLLHKEKELRPNN